MDSDKFMNKYNKGPFVEAVDDDYGFEELQR